MDSEVKDFSVTIAPLHGGENVTRIYKNMEGEEAARAEALCDTIGRVVEVKCLTLPEPAVEAPREAPKPHYDPRKDDGPELAPGETENVVVGYNNNPAILFGDLGIL